MNRILRYPCGTSRPLFFFLVACTPLLGLGACELVLGDLPPVRDGGPGPGGSGGGTVTTSTSGTTTGVTTTADTTTSVSTTTSATTSSSTSSTSSTGTGTCCDCDGDGDPSPECDGGDCDDHDPTVHSNEMTYYPTPSPNPAVGFDYNCNNQLERDPALSNTVTCALTDNPNTCVRPQGYLSGGIPQCGKSGPWGTCKKGPITGCVNDVLVQDQVMTCR